jgi:hypothetical protein
MQARRISAGRGAAPRAPDDHPFSAFVSPLSFPSTPVHILKFLCPRTTNFTKISQLHIKSCLFTPKSGAQRAQPLDVSALHPRLRESLWLVSHGRSSMPGHGPSRPGLCRLAIAHHSSRIQRTVVTYSCWWNQPCPQADWRDLAFTAFVLSPKLVCRILKQRPATAAQKRGSRLFCSWASADYIQAIE